MTPKFNQLLHHWRGALSAQPGSGCRQPRSAPHGRHGVVEVTLGCWSHTSPVGYHLMFSHRISKSCERSVFATGLPAEPVAGLGLSQFDFPAGDSSVHRLGLLVTCTFSMVGMEELFRERVVAGLQKLGEMEPNPQYLCPPRCKWPRFALQHVQS